MHKLLIVDDERDVEILFTQKFRKEVAIGEFVLNFAYSGEEALEYMRGLNPFDVVLIMSDINMPGISGLDLLSKAKELFPHLKVVMISAYGDAKHVDKANELGADGFHTKPVDFTQLKSSIHQLLNIHKP